MFGSDFNVGLMLIACSSDQHIVRTFYLCAVRNLFNSLGRLLNNVPSFNGRILTLTNVNLSYRMIDSKAPDTMEKKCI